MLHLILYISLAVALGEASPQYQDLLYRYFPVQGQTYPGVYQGYRGRIFQEQAAVPYLDEGLGAGNDFPLEVMTFPSYDLGHLGGGYHGQVRPYPDDGYQTDFSPLEAGPYDPMGYRTSNWMQHRNPYRQ